MAGNTFKVASAALNRVEAAESEINICAKQVSNIVAQSLYVSGRDPRLRNRRLLAIRNTEARFASKQSQCEEERDRKWDALSTATCDNSKEICCHCECMDCLNIRTEAEFLNEVVSLYSIHCLSLKKAIFVLLEK